MAAITGSFGDAAFAFGLSVGQEIAVDGAAALEADAPPAVEAAAPIWERLRGLCWWGYVYKPGEAGRSVLRIQRVCL